MTETGPTHPTRPAPAVDRRFEALVLDLDAVVAATRDDEAAEIARLVEECRGEGLDIVVLERDAGDGDGGRAVAASRALDELWERGIAPAQALVWAGGEPPLHALLADQLARRRAGEVPEVAELPGWALCVAEPDVERERATEALLAIGDGRVGTRGALALPLAESAPGTLVAGVYRGDGPETELLPGPVWNVLATREVPRGGRRCLDLRTGVLAQRLDLPEGAVEVVELAALAQPGVAALRAAAPPGVLAEQQGLAGGSGRGPLAERLVCASPTGAIAAAVADTRRREADGSERLDRVAAYAWSASDDADVHHAAARAAEQKLRGFEALLAEQRAAWAQRWAACDMAIEGDDQLQLAVRLALHHLIASTPDAGEGAVGARGLTGGAYRGHVFWDADAFVLPFHAATSPSRARAMLEYRLARLPAARAEARARGRAGARFPWESAGSGREVTPPSGTLPTGERVPIRTGELEDHVVADVAWAAHTYVAWTGDAAFAAGPGRELLVQTARFWASRIAIEEGRAHVRGVIGPDEHHEDVDDNAYTNVMARWNLRAAAAAMRDEPSLAGERRHWLDLAERLVDGYDPATGLYEQCAGFFGLEPLVIDEVVARRPVSAPIALGTARVAGAQVLKQADVLMLHYMVPDEVAPGSLVPNLDFYEPRTAHGSTLSPGVHAALFARAGRPEEALRWLRLTAGIDLDDISGTTAGGVHLAAMGSVWRTLAWGFAGLAPRDGALVVDPRPLPAAWRALDVRVRFRGTPVRVRLDRDGAEVRPTAPVTVRPGGRDAEPMRVGPAGARVPFGPRVEALR